MEILKNHDQGPDLRALQDDSPQCFNDSIFPLLRAHGDLLDAAFFYRKELQKIGKG